QRKDTEVPQPSGSTELITDEAANEEHVPVQSNDPLLSEITKLKERVKKLKRRNKSRTPGLKMLRKVGRTTRIESSEDERNDENLMFDTGVFDEEEVEVEKTLIEIKAVKPKAVTTAATTTTTTVTRPKARGVVVQKPSEFRITSSSSQTLQLPQVKDKGKDNTQSMMEADYELAQRLQAEEQGCKKAEMEQESSSKRAGEKLESDNSKKQKLDESVEVKVDDEAKIKKHMEIVSDDEVAIDAIPLATKHPIIVDWKIINEGKIGYFQIIRANGSSRRYSSVIKMLQNIDKEDLETLWKLVKAKHGIQGHRRHMKECYGVI
ncbi:hypothetical protein Tco_1479485, partial [Tanacetum coccineum]